jgi:NADH-quinone oxidoreductase subunit L
MTFFDRPRSPAAAHEPTAAMRWPLLALAVPTVLLGVVGLRESWLPAWLATGGRAAESLHLSPVTSVLSVLLAIGGAGVVYLRWRPEPAGDPTATLRVRTALERAFYVDELYDRLFVRPVRAATGGVRWTDDAVVGGAVRGAGAETGRLARLVSWTQGGNVQGYLTGLLAGVLLLVVGVVTLT